MEEKKDVCTAELSRQEQGVIDAIRGLNFGELRVVIIDGKPNRIEEIKKSIKL